MLFLSGQGGLEISVTNMKSGVGPQTAIYINNYPMPFLSGQGGLEISVTNMKSGTGLQTVMISHDAGSESAHPATQHLLVHLNLCSTETFNEIRHITSHHLTKLHLNVRPAILKPQYLAQNLSCKGICMLLKLISEHSTRPATKELR